MVINSFDVFYQTSESLPKLYEYSLSGSLLNLSDALDYLGNTIHYYDAKINSEGSLIIMGYQNKIFCLDTEFIMPSSQDWHSVNGGNTNTNSL